jgi:hypothetical protein
VQLLGRAREGAGVGHVHERAQLAELHASLIAGISHRYCSRAAGLVPSAA